jgi:hypothetical protein
VSDLPARACERMRQAEKGALVAAGQSRKTNRTQGETRADNSGMIAPIASVCAISLILQLQGADDRRPPDVAMLE